LREKIRGLAEAVAKTGYLVGDQFTLADSNLMPILVRIKPFPEGAEATAGTKHLARLLRTQCGAPQLSEHGGTDAAGGGELKRSVQQLGAFLAPVPIARY
jgi:glutathione S-transferase